VIKKEQKQWFQNLTPAKPSNENQNSKMEKVQKIGQTETFQN